MTSCEYRLRGKMYAKVNNQFSVWLEEQMREREWTQAELARKAGLTRGAINNILTQHRQPGPEAARAIAHALDLPEEEVFRQAGLLSAKPEEPPGLGQWIRMYVLADEEERDRMLDIAETLSRRSRK